MKNFDQTRTLILQFAEKIKEETGLDKLLSKEAWGLIKNDSNAFLFGLISDQSVKAEIAWSLPWELKKRIGHLDIGKIEKLDHGELTNIFRIKPALHRYPGPMAKYLISASKKLNEKYQGMAENIWKTTVTAQEMIKRLEEFDGIGHKKASLGIMLQKRDFGLDIPDISSIDIAYDVHIRRIFLRCGLVEADTSMDVLQAARNLYPQYPGLLTTPFWIIGRKWCKAIGPDCNNCPLQESCEKKLYLG